VLVCELVGGLCSEEVVCCEVLVEDGMVVCEGKEVDVLLVELVVVGDVD